ncbi:MAG: potassium channel family protein [Thermoleophilia bacterium]
MAFRLLEREMGKMLVGIQRNPFGGAWRATAVITVTVTVVSGVLMRLTDPDEYSNVWEGLWWSAQTVTTVGYGDILPSSAAGRLLAVLVMMIGVTFLTVTSAAIASAFVESARRRRVAAGEGEASAAELHEELRQLSEEVRRLRADLDRAGVTRPPDPSGS